MMQRASNKELSKHHHHKKSTLKSKKKAKSYELKYKAESLEPFQIDSHSKMRNQQTRSNQLKRTLFLYELFGTMWNIYGWTQVKSNWLAGMTNLLSAWILCKPVSGSFFNPAVTLREYVLS